MQGRNQPAPRGFFATFNATNEDILISPEGLDEPGQRLKCLPLEVLAWNTIPR